MSENKMHWYMVGIIFSKENNPNQHSYTVFLTTENKYENINKSMVDQFSYQAKEQIEKNTDIKIQNLIPVGIEYLGFMSNDEFYSK